MLNYKFSIGKNGEVSGIIRSDEWAIPIDEANTDYQAYLKWLDEGGVASPPDDITSMSDEVNNAV